MSEYESLCFLEDIVKGNVKLISNQKVAAAQRERLNNSSVFVLYDPTERPSAPLGFQSVHLTACVCVRRGENSRL